MVAELERKIDALTASLGATRRVRVLGEEGSGSVSAGPSLAGVGIWRNGRGMEEDGKAVRVEVLESATMAPADRLAPGVHYVDLSTSIF